MPSYTAVIPPDEPTYNVIFPALPGCITWGVSIEDAETQATEAIIVYLDSMAAHGEPFPADTRIPYQPRTQAILRTITV